MFQSRQHTILATPFGVVIETSPVSMALLQGSLIISTQLLLAASQLATPNTKSTFGTQVPSSRENRIRVTNLMDERALHSGKTTGFKPISWNHCVTALEGSEDSTGSKAKDDGACKSCWNAVSTF
ncbi:hypothetical protein VP01_9115g1 [Puccinia sorghi]|uniref:Uncharacterized protein n=1 Tax=Puccinia sorghi TaxID=27349 RepID=A0A0L6U9N8_9BASI|nr:hypothetical protein VP01_9115g1 [Puccinia sorghi]